MTVQKCIALRHIGCLMILLIYQAEAKSECQQQSSCRFVCTNIPGQGDVNIDLSELDHPDDKRFSDIRDKNGRTYIYKWNPCKTFSTVSPCDNVNVCQTNTENKQTFSLGSKVSMYYHTKKNQFVLSYTDGARNPRVTNVTLVYKSGEKGKASDVDEIRPKVYIFDVKTKYAPHNGNGDDSGGGISTGTVMLIIFFSLVVLYLGIGIAFLKYRRGAHGKDMIPNYEFWSKIPGLVKDGCVFSGKRTKECITRVKEKSVKKEQGEYEKI